MKTSAVVKADMARTAAFEALLRFEKSGANRLKADSLIHEAAGHYPGLTETDRGFLHALVMGVLRSWFRQEARMLLLTGRELKRIEAPVRTLLRMGLFQLDGMSQVPAYAAINSTVELARARKVSPRTIKFINAVLREGQRRLEANSFPIPVSEADMAGHLLWQCGWPEAWTRQLLTEYPAESALAMAQAAQNPTPLTIRVNTLKVSPEAYRSQLETAGIAFSQVDEALPEALRLDSLTGSPRQLPGYEEGLFYVQDPASMWVARLLAAQPHESVLDLCAAPGSKTTHLAALMENTGLITAIEPKKDRLRLLDENLQRLGVTNTMVLMTNGLDFNPETPVGADDFVGAYDKVLVDAPCSGSGTLRRHPEILLQVARLDLKAYRKQQTALLKKGFSLLKPGGVLVYSTCSILREENHAVVAEFLKHHRDARLEMEEQRLPTQNTDGFYAARIQKI